MHRTASTSSARGWVHFERRSGLCYHQQLWWHQHQHHRHPTRPSSTLSIDSRCARLSFRKDGVAKRTNNSSRRRRWVPQCSQQEYWTEEREGEERQKLADLKAELAQIKEKMETYRRGIEQYRERQERLKKGAKVAMAEVDENTARKLLEKKTRLEHEVEENETKIKLLQSLAVKLTEAISKQELFIISRRPIQTTLRQEPSAVNYSQPAAETQRSAGDVTEQFVKWERETLEALIGLDSSDAAEGESRKSPEPPANSVTENLQRLRQDLELVSKKRDLYRKEENYAKVQQCTAVITEMSNLISRLEDFDTESMLKSDQELLSSSLAKSADEKSDKSGNDQDDDITSEDLEWFLTQASKQEWRQEEERRAASEIPNRPALEDDLAKKIKILVNMKNRGQDFSFSDMLEVRRLCSQLGTTLFIDNPKIRSGIYKAGLNFVIAKLLESSPFRKGNTTAGSTGLLGINSITNEAVVRDFLIPFARDLDLKPRIAIDIIEAGVTSKLKSLMLQAVAKLNLKDQAMAEETIGQIIRLLQALPLRATVGNLGAIAFALRPFMTDELIASILELCKKKGASETVLKVVEFCLRSL